MNKFRDTYRIPSTRAPFWDYGWNGAYFVTICTKNRENYFGEISDGKIELSEIGEIARQEWLKTFEMRPDMKLTMGEYVIMPNHFHAIIIIGENEYNANRDDNRDANRRDAMHCVSTIPTVPPIPTVPVTNDDTNNIIPTQNCFGPQSKNLASIVRGLKISVTKNARIINPAFAWQSRFYDHIIRDDESFNRISEYIKNNPANWHKDDYHDQ